MTVEDEVDLHVFHPTDEGWKLPFRYLPTILPDDLWVHPANTSMPVKDICHSGGWFDRLGYSDKDQRIAACCGFWMLIDGWMDMPAETDEAFESWLLRVSHLQRLRDFKKILAKRAYMEP